MAKKIKKPSLFVTRTIKRATVKGVKIFLRAFCQREVKDYAGEIIVPERIIYYMITAKDGSAHKATELEDAVAKFEQLKIFESKQQLLWQN